ncbi:MAG: ATP-binding cassette domain-containing protein [Acidimicrobiia bacterium]|nr:ATP-binding cassette domain-containing protein [Acidimicrobiia bacterium]
MMLALDDVSMRYGGILAVDGVTLRVERGEIRCLIGPNGAGKTTLFNIIAGAVRPTSGTIHLADREVTGLGARRLSHLGVGRKYQAPSVFDEFTVRQNLQTAADGKRAPHRLMRRDRDLPARVVEIAGEVGLEGFLGDPAGQLSHGHRQWLEIGMVLINDPQLLLLDEPTAGMTREETAATGALIRRICSARGLTAIVIEHDTSFVTALADRITVLHEGRVLLEGTAAEVEGDQEVRRVYLGMR